MENSLLCCSRGPVSDSLDCLGGNRQKASSDRRFVSLCKQECLELSWKSEEFVSGTTLHTDASQGESSFANTILHTAQAMALS